MAAILGVEASRNSNSLLSQTSAVNAASTTSSSSSDSDSATISANDFLVLLVTEMKNQDPTASTDPNEYINQLVNVNSLQQLISINETLTDAVGSSSSSTTGYAVSAEPLSSATQSSSSGASSSGAAGVAGGNLGIPAASSAAERISTALSSARS